MAKGNRYLVLIVALAIHVAFIMAFISVLRFHAVSPSRPSNLTAIILLKPAGAARVINSKRLQSLPLMTAPEPSYLSVPAVKIPAMPAPEATHARTIVDWTDAARRAVAAITQQASGPLDHQLRSKALGTMIPSLSWQGIPLHSWFQAPAHHVGENYMASTGQGIVWLSDRCYQISQLPLSGASQNILQMEIPTTVCSKQSDQPRGDLFKELPAYKKYGPQ